MLLNISEPIRKSHHRKCDYVKCSKDCSTRKRRKRIKYNVKKKRKEVTATAVFFSIKIGAMFKGSLRTSHQLGKEKEMKNH